MYTHERDITPGVSTCLACIPMFIASLIVTGASTAVDLHDYSLCFLSIQLGGLLTCACGAAAHLIVAAEMVDLRAMWRVSFIRELVTLSCFTISGTCLVLVIYAQLLRRAHVKETPCVFLLHATITSAIVAELGVMVMPRHRRLAENVV